MKLQIALSLMLVSALMGCARVNLVVINATEAPIKNVEIKLNDKSTTVPEIAAGATHQQSLKVEEKVSVNVNYQNATGQQHYTSSSIDLKPGDGGSLRLSVTAKGTLEAVRVK